MRMRAVSLVVGALVATSSVAAQTRETAAPPPRGGRAAPPPRARGQLPPDATARQQALARQVRQAFAGVVRQQLNLNDDQARRLQQVDQRFQQQRNETSHDERDARLSLRTALEDTTTAPDQAKVEEYLARLVKAQHRRAEILEAEQKDLAEFLTPLQRAKFLALREQLQRRVQQLRDSVGVGRGAPPPER